MKLTRCGRNLSAIAVLVVFCTLATIVNGTVLKNRQSSTVNQLNELEEESIITAFNKYMTVEERSLLEKTIDKIASRLIFVPTKISKIGQKFINGLMNAEDGKMWSMTEILEMWAKSRLEKTIVDNRQFVKETILELMPVESNVVFKRFLDNNKDVEIAKDTILKVAKFLPEAMEGFQQSLDAVDRNQINRIVGTYLYTLVEMMPEAKWILNVMEQMTDDDYKALGQMITQMNKNLEAILERTSPFLRQQFQEILQMLNEMTDDEARQYVSAVYRRILNAILVIRDEADLFKVFHQLMDTIIVTTRDYRKLSRSSMENVERSFPLLNRMMRALDKTVEKVAQMNSFICQKMQSDTSGSDNRYFGKRC